MNKYYVKIGKKFFVSIVKLNEFSLCYRIIQFLTYEAKRRSGNDPAEGLLDHHYVSIEPAKLTVRCNDTHRPENEGGRPRTCSETYIRLTLKSFCFAPKDVDT